MTSRETQRQTPDSSVRALRWEGGRVGLLDQRRLPAQVEYLWCSSAPEVAAAIRQLVVRGAPAIGCAAAYGLAMDAARLSELPGSQFGDALRRSARLLADARPTAVNLTWALDRMLRALARAPEKSGATAVRALEQEARRIHREDLEANLAMGEVGAALIPDGARVLTHCNAGALATSGHGTALGVIRSAVAQGKRVSVYADETRPVLQGARLTAWELMQDGIPTTLIADGAAGHLMSRGEIDLVVVGADRVAANGDAANKVGTYPLAVLARRHAISFYVACPLSTIDRTLRDGSGIPIEERAAEEVTGFGGVQWAPEGVAVRNPAFDVTPAELITALVTERGLVQPPSEPGIRALFESD